MSLESRSEKEFGTNIRVSLRIDIHFLLYGRVSDSHECPSHSQSNLISQGVSSRPSLSSPISAQVPPPALRATLPSRLMHRPAVSAPPLPRPPRPARLLTNR